MIREATAEDHAALTTGDAPAGTALADTAVAPPAVLQMLGDVAARVRETFEPASWLIIEDQVLVGLCSVVRPPQDGIIDIGYGIAPSEHNRGIASRAVCEIVAWARTDPRVHAVIADTSPDNIPSQRVLERAGFEQVGERVDVEDGLVMCWRCATA